ncbi:hypothetical protein [uncultured Cohaesibacter sp.]|uniref:hypothetical protein n=1 Tax=uncultured Cohaesibacter sp. TaxID=1002546 RepID=UPI00292EE886|nr:hypothetical protein [uncultured Cohaesibacter sp.]
MTSNEKEIELFQLAREIAIDSEAILPLSYDLKEQTATQGTLDAQILAYSIGREKVRQGNVEFDFPVLMQAIEKIIEDAA